VSSACHYIGQRSRSRTKPSHRGNKRKIKPCTSITHLGGTSQENNKPEWLHMYAMSCIVGQSVRRHGGTAQRLNLVSIRHNVLPPGCSVDAKLFRDILGRPRLSGVRYLLGRRPPSFPLYLGMTDGYSAVVLFQKTNATLRPSVTRYWCFMRKFYQMEKVFFSIHAHSKQRAMRIYTGEQGLDFSC